MTRRIIGIVLFLALIAGGAAIIRHKKQALRRLRRRPSALPSR